MGTSLGVDELRRDAEAVVGTLYTAFEHVADLELASELGGVHRLALVAKAGVAREHAQVACPRQLSQDVFGQAVAKIFLFRIAAQIIEGEDRDRRTFGHADQRVLDRAFGYCRGIQRSRVSHALATPSIGISTKAGTIICHRTWRSDPPARAGPRHPLQQLAP